MGRSGKGSAWERDLCRLLSLWWSEGEDDGLFWRTSGSGSRATVRSRKGGTAHGQHGDIGPTHPLVEPLFTLLTIEAKKGYNNLDLLSLVDGGQAVGNHLLEQWIAQAKQSSEDASVPHYWIIFRRDRHSPMSLIDKALFQRLRSSLGPYPSTGSSFLCRSHGESFCLFPLEEFLLWASPSVFGGS